MRIARIYSHLNGHEWLLVHRKQLWQEVEDVISSVDASKCRTKQSKEKRKVGQMLYSPVALNEFMAAELESRDGWEVSRTPFWLTDDHELLRKTLELDPDEQKKEIMKTGKQPIYSYNQTDFVKERVAVEVQFGKYSFIEYDIFVKHLAFYIGDKIDVGIEILPMKSMQEHMSSGPGYFEKGLYDIVRQGRGVPAVPLVLVGVEP